eukprot:g10306.t1
MRKDQLLLGEYRLESLQDEAQATSPDSASSLSPNEEPAMKAEMWDFSTEAEDEDGKKEVEQPDMSKLQQNLLAHQMGRCKPCSYFYFKEDRRRTHWDNLATVY